MDGIQIPGRQEPGRQEPLELPGRNSSTYGDGDIPEIDLPGADSATHDFPQEFPETACSPDKPGLHFCAFLTHPFPGLESCHIL